MQRRRARIRRKTSPQARKPVIPDFRPIAAIPPSIARRKPILRRLVPVLIGLVVIAAILFGLYYFLAAPKDAAREAGGNPAATQTDPNSVYLTLLEPTDLSALTTAGRGSADLVNEQNQQFLRLKSIRSGADSRKIADPILIELKPGVMEQAAGQKATVELRAKSGESGPATFSIECLLGGESICNRKRFRIGLQPEAVFFELDLRQHSASEGPAFLAINTDVTSAADIGGQGETLDLLYVRIRLSGR